MALTIIGSILIVLITVCVLFFWRSTKYSFDESHETRKVLYILAGVLMGMFAIIVSIGWFLCLNSYLICVYKGDKQNPSWGYYSGCVDVGVEKSNTKPLEQNKQITVKVSNENACRMLVKECLETNKHDMCRVVELVCTD